jgi:hypothetical protein
MEKLLFETKVVKELLTFKPVRETFIDGCIRRRKAVIKSRVTRYCSHLLTLVPSSRIFLP